MEGPQNGHAAHELPGICQLYREFIKGYADKVYPIRQLMPTKGRSSNGMKELRKLFCNIMRELSEVPVLGMPRH